MIEVDRLLPSMFRGVKIPQQAKERLRRRLFGASKPCINLSDAVRIESEPGQKEDQPINEALRSFLQKASVDEDLQIRMQSAASAEEAYEIATEFSGGYSFEEFAMGMKKVSAALLGITNGELTDDDLALVAGGKSFGAGFAQPLQATGAAAGAASAAAT